MRDIRKKKCNPIVNLSKFTLNIKWNCSLSPLSSLLSNFVYHVIMFGIKKFKMAQIFLKSKKIINFLKFIYNNCFFFQVKVVSVTTRINVKPPLFIESILILTIDYIYVYWRSDVLPCYPPQRGHPCLWKLLRNLDMFTAVVT